MSSATLISSFYESASKDIFCSLNHVKTHDQFSPTPVSPSIMNFPDNRMMQSMEEDFRKQQSAQNFPLMRSMSCVAPSTKSTVLSVGNDSVFSNNIYDNSNDSNRPRDRAFSDSDRNQRNQNSNRYKTEMCRPYEENGKCKYGDKCQFAHGGHEVRNLQRHPKYKTELCRTYHTVGICPYGPRCHFIHNPNERKWGMSPPKQRKDKSVERPKLLHFASAPLGSTGDLTPPRSGCDSPSPFSPLANVESGEHLLAALTAQARELATSDQSELIMSPRGMSPRGMSPTIPSPIGSAPESPFYSGPRRAGFNMEVHHMKDNVFFPNGVDSKPNSPVGYRPPSPPDSDPESYCDRSTSPSSVGSMRSARLPIFRVMSMEEYR